MGLRNKSIELLLSSLFISAGYKASIGAQYYLEFGKDRQESISINPEVTLSYKSPDISEIQDLLLTTEDDVEFEATLFDRGSDTLIVLGQGFPGGKESMYGYKKKFTTYDLIAFDYRWNNIISYSANPKTLIHPINRLVLDSTKEIEAVLEFAQDSGYKKIIALGNCYSNFLFASLANRFDKIILDSCWLSVNAFAESIIEDPLIPIWPQDGGTPECLKKILKTRFVKTPLMFLLNFILPKLSIEDHLKKIEATPVLFIYGQKDLMVSKTHFETIWNSTSSPNKFVFVTPHEHSNNTENPLIYSYVCSKFIESLDTPTFIKNIKGIANEQKSEKKSEI